jgi:hypothetical protein
VKNQLIGLFEKAATTYVEAFLAVLAASSTLGVSVLQSAAIASIPAALTVIANGIPQPPAHLPFYTDMAFRTVRTYVVSFVGILVAMPMFDFSMSVLQTAALGALPAAFAVVKGVLAGRVGNRDTSALLPLRYDTQVLALKSEVASVDTGDVAGDVADADQAD